jgi:cholesterol transport system auxiliary component
VRWAIHRLAAVCGLAVLAGCAGALLETDLAPRALYVIASAPAPKAPVAAGPLIDLSIGRPDVAPGLDTNRIAVLQGRRLDYYRASAWNGTLSEVVQTLLVQSMENQNLFRSVAPEQARVSGDYVLDVEVRDFQAEYDRDGAAPTVRVKMIGRLIRIADRKLLASLAAESVQPADADRMHAVAAAFESAAQQVALELAHEISGAIGADAVER